MLREHLDFFRQFRTRFHTTGAIAPSSPFLARAMTAPLSQHASRARILEVGPGTGAVTRRLVRMLGPHDRLDLVEINEHFAGLLEESFRTDPAFRAVRDRCQVHVCGIETFPSAEGYDFIISGLPLNNFSPEFVTQVMDAFFRLLAPGGVLSYFEYMFVRSLRSRLSRGAERDRLEQLSALLGSYLERYRFRRDWVWPNFPPAWVQHLRKD